MTHSKIFLSFCLSFIIGIFLSSIFSISQPTKLGFLFLAILFIFFSLLFENKKLMIIGFYFIFVLVGIQYYQSFDLKIINNELGKYNDKNETIFLVGLVSAEPDVRESNIKLEINSQRLIIGNDKIDIRGKVLVTTNLYPQYYYGDKLKIKGELNSPPVFEDFNYKDYLAKEGIYSVIYWPQIEELSKNNYGNPAFLFYDKILFWKEKLRESICRSLSPPQSSILGSMILGDKRRISEDLKEKLNIAGIRHITAISGMHITILSVVLMQFLIGIGFWRNQAFYLTIILLVLFIAMVGLPSSAVRAGIMVGFFLFSQKIGRKNYSARTVIFAATLILITNPLLLRFDVGFQLSFLAVTGIIYLSPIFQIWFKKIPEKEFINLRSIVSMTLAAQIFTLPILIYNFGNISLVAPITNILILPLLPFVIGLGFLFSLTGIFFPIFGQILSWPCWLLLTYIVRIIDWFYSLSFSSVVIGNVHWLWLIIFYLFLGFLIWRFQEKNKLKFLNYQ